MSLSSQLVTKRLRNQQLRQSQGSDEQSIEGKERHLTDNQRKDLMAAFKTYEKGGRNKISVKDFGALVRSLGWNPSEIDIEQARHELDIKGNGSIGYDDLEHYIARKGMMIDECSAEDVQAAFHVLDTTGTGNISTSDFRHLLTTLGERMSDEEATDFLKTMDRDGRGEISYREFTSFMEWSPIKFAIQSINYIHYSNTLADNRNVCIARKYIYGAVSENM